MPKSSQIRAWIFDQDGTLHPRSGVLYRLLVSRTKKWLGATLGKTRREIDAIYDSLQRTHPHPFDGFQSLGCDLLEYQRVVYDELELAQLISPDPALRALLVSLPGDKYVVTLAPPGYSSRLLDGLGIAELMTGLIVVSPSGPSYSKGLSYQRILTTNRLDPKEVAVVGDTLSVDILPALSLGCQCFLIASEARMDDPGGSNIEVIPSLEALRSRTG